MDERVNRPALIIVTALLIGGAILVPLLLAGGQTSRILSTVGGAVNIDAGSGARATTAPEPGSGTGSGHDGGGAEIADISAAVPTLLIVRTGELRLEVADLATAVRDGDAAVVAAGGYVSGSTRVASGADESAEATYRIPSGRWAATLDILHGLARRIAAEQIATEEVTGQVVDLVARIANLRATEAALQAIMARAAKISDVLAVQEQLTTTRGEIEQLVAKKAQLEDQASFGSLKVMFHHPQVVAPAVPPLPVKGWDPGTDAAKATDQLVRVGQAGTTAGIWLAIVGLPLLIAAAVLAVAGWQLSRLARWVIRRREPGLDPAG